RGYDSRVVSDLGPGLDLAVKEATDDAFMDEGIADAESALGDELRHPCRSTGAARRAVDRLFAIEDRIARIRLFRNRATGPKDVRYPADRRVFGMHTGDRLIEPLPQFP